MSRKVLILNQEKKKKGTSICKLRHLNRFRKCTTLHLPNSSGDIYHFLLNVLPPRNSDRRPGHCTRRFPV